VIASAADALRKPTAQLINKKIVLWMFAAIGDSIGLVSSRQPWLYNTSEFLTLSEPIPGSDSFAACWLVMSICSPCTTPSLTGPAPGSRLEGVFEKRYNSPFHSN
jgi:hypothetical protein